MKTWNRIAGVTFIGLLSGAFLVGCVHSQVGSASAERRIGAMMVGGVTYYPANPGATYHNEPIDFTTNPPPAGAVNYVTVISTNRIVIHPID